MDKGWDSEDQAYFERDCHVARRACVALITLAKRGILRKDILTWAARYFVWPTRKYRNAWKDCSLEDTGHLRIITCYWGESRDIVTYCKLIFVSSKPLLK